MKLLNILKRIDQVSLIDVFDIWAKNWKTLGLFSVAFGAATWVILQSNQTTFVSSIQVKLSTNQPTSYYKTQKYVDLPHWLRDVELEDKLDGAAETSFEKSIKKFSDLHPIGPPSLFDAISTLAPFSEDNLTVSNRYTLVGEYNYIIDIYGFSESSVNKQTLKLSSDLENDFLDRLRELRQEILTTRLQDIQTLAFGEIRSLENSLDFEKTSLRNFRAQAIMSIEESLAFWKKTNVLYPLESFGFDEALLEQFTTSPMALEEFKKVHSKILLGPNHWRIVKLETELEHLRTRLGRTKGVLNEIEKNPALLISQQKNHTPFAWAILKKAQKTKNEGVLLAVIEGTLAGLCFGALVSLTRSLNNAKRQQNKTLV